VVDVQVGIRMLVLTKGLMLLDGVDEGSLDLALAL